MKRGLILAVFVVMVLSLIPGVAMAHFSQDLVPDMTSYTSPSGTVIYDSEYSSDYRAWMAFDDSSASTAWVSHLNVNSSNPAYLGYDFGSNKRISRYLMTVEESNSRSPKDWTFEGWNGSQWVVLDTRTGINHEWANEVTREFSFNNNNNYTKYRINVTSQNGTNGLYIKNFEMKELTDNEPDIVPSMANDTAPSGTVIYNTQYSGYYAWRAFDNDWGTGWIPGFFDISTSNPCWIGYQFGNGVKINKYSITCRETPGRAPKDWTFEGWDGSQWVVLDTQSGKDTGWQNDVPREFAFTNNNNYTQYRLNITASNGTVGVYIMELEMMETASSVPGTPTNLSATAGDAQVSLSWDAVTGATSYKVKRATTSGGPYTEIATGVTAASYTDTGLTNGTTYYYVVTAVISGSESSSSNEASATPTEGTIPPPSGGDDALLVITMTNGMEKEYQLSASDISSFLSWYNGRAGGSGNAYYMVSKSYNLGPFSSRKDYIVFDKILSFEVMEY